MRQFELLVYIERTVDLQYNKYGKLVIFIVCRCYNPHSSSKVCMDRTKREYFQKRRRADLHRNATHGREISIFLYQEPMILQCLQMPPCPSKNEYTHTQAKQKHAILVINEF